MLSWLPFRLWNTNSPVTKARPSNRVRLCLEALEARDVPAAVTPLGNEFQIDGFTSGIRTTPAVTAQASGNFVVTYSADDGNNLGVYVQRLDSIGNRIGSQILANSFTTDFQINASIAADGTGNFVVVWQSLNQDSEGWGIFGQRFDALGNPIGSEFLINTTEIGDQTSPVVAMDAAGNFVVAWEHFSSIDFRFDVRAQRFNSSGNRLGSEFVVSQSLIANEGTPTIAMASLTGQFVIAWQNDQDDGSGFGVFARLFNPNGTPATGIFPVNQTTIGNQGFPSAGMDAIGNFVIAWEGEDGSSFGVFARSYAPNGIPVTSERLINTTTLDGQYDPAVTVDDKGNYVITWVSVNQDGDAEGIYLQAFDPEDNLTLGEIQAPTNPMGVQLFPAIAYNNQDRFLVVWESDFTGSEQPGIYGRIFDTEHDIIGFVPNTVSVIENAPVGTYVNTLLLFESDHNFQYRLVSLDSRITFNPTPFPDQFDIFVNDLIDFESSQNFVVPFQVRDFFTDALVFSGTLSVDVFNQNEAPTGIDLIDADTLQVPVEVLEETPNGTVIGLLSATDPDAFDFFTFTLLDSAGGTFGISGNQLILLDASLLGSQFPTANILVEVQDSQGLPFQQAFSINIFDEDVDGPTITVSGPSGVQLDSDDQNYTWDISDPSGISFSLVELKRDGIVVFSSAALNGSIDFNVFGTGTFDLEITATDADGDHISDQSTSTNSQSVTVQDDDTQGPIILISGGPPLQFVDDTQEFSWLVTDSSGLAVVDVQILRNGIVIFASDQDQGTFNFDSFGEGTYSISISAVDADTDFPGDESVSTSSLFVDVEPTPQLPEVVFLGGSQGMETDQEDQFFTWALNSFFNDGFTVTMQTVVTRNGVVIFQSSALQGEFDFNSFGTGVYELKVQTTITPSGELREQNASPQTFLKNRQVIVVDDQIEKPDILIGGTGIQPLSFDQGVTWEVTSAAGLSSVDVRIFHQGQLVFTSDQASGFFDPDPFGVGFFVIQIEAMDGDTDSAQDTSMSFEIGELLVVDDTIGLPFLPPSLFDDDDDDDDDTNLSLPSDFFGRADGSGDRSPFGDEGDFGERGEFGDEGGRPEGDNPPPPPPPPPPRGFGNLLLLDNRQGVKRPFIPPNEDRPRSENFQPEQTPPAAPLTQRFTELRIDRDAVVTPVAKPLAQPTQAISSVFDSDDSVSLIEQLRQQIPNTEVPNLEQTALPNPDLEPATTKEEQQETAPETEMEEAEPMEIVPLGFHQPNLESEVEPRISSWWVYTVSLLGSLSMIAVYQRMAIAQKWLEEDEEIDPLDEVHPLV